MTSPDDVTGSEQREEFRQLDSLNTFHGLNPTLADAGAGWKHRSAIAFYDPDPPILNSVKAAPFFQLMNANPSLEVMHKFLEGHRDGEMVSRSHAILALEKG